MSPSTMVILSAMNASPGCRPPHALSGAPAALRSATKVNRAFERLQPRGINAIFGKSVEDTQTIQHPPDRIAEPDDEHPNVVAAGLHDQVLEASEALVSTKVTSDKSRTRE